MDSNEAKNILRAYRPGMASDDDPRLAEALELARRDPVLAAWFDEHCALHEALKGKFRGIPLPANLKERILTGRKGTKPVIWWRSRAAFAAAAVIALALTVAAVVRVQATSDIRAYRRDMVQFVADLYRMNSRASTWDDLRHVFAKQGWPSEFTVPNALRSARLEGGCMTYWREQKVSLVCMKSAEEKGLWLFVIDQAALPKPQSAQTPQFGKTGKLNTATWSNNDHVYLLATNGDVKELKKHL